MNKLKKLWSDTRAVSAETAIAAFITATIVIIAGIYLIPVIAHEVDSVIFNNSSDWNFTGHAGAAAIMGLIPFIFIAGILIAAVGLVLYEMAHKT